MTATTLDQKTALVVVDLQKGIVDLPTAHPAADIVANSATLADAFRAKGLPVVLVRVTGGAPGRTEGAPAPGSRLPIGPTSSPSSARATATSWSPSSSGAPSTAPTSTFSCAAAVSRRSC